jgi:hypothetical protein
MINKPTIPTAISEGPAIIRITQKLLGNVPSREMRFNNTPSGSGET